eukprot:773620-Prorocentrum_lima.AAC.1
MSWWTAKLWPGRFTDIWRPSARIVPSTWAYLGNAAADACAKRATLFHPPIPSEDLKHAAGQKQL